MYTTLGNKIKKYRQEMGLSQLELSQMIGVSRRTVSDYETGNTEPNLVTLRMIAKTLDVTYSQLLDDTCFEERLKKKTNAN